VALIKCDCVLIRTWKYYAKNMDPQRKDHYVLIEEAQCGVGRSSSPLRGGRSRKQSDTVTWQQQTLTDTTRS
jgi:hypothetical protein